MDVEKLKVIKRDMDTVDLKIPNNVLDYITDCISFSLSYEYNEWVDGVGYECAWDDNPELTMEEYKKEWLIKNKIKEKVFNKLREFQKVD